jgi:hypothetical protein
LYWAGLTGGEVKAHGKVGSESKTILRTIAKGL